MNYEGYYDNGHISFGPWGGENGARWDDGVYSSVRQVVICHGASIDSIQIEYDKKGYSIWSENHGGTGGIKTNKVKLDYPDEYLVSISGHFGSEVEDGPVLVRSLVFKSNRKKYGPFGIQQGTYFSFPLNNAKVVGFHGQSSWYLDSIGVYVKALPPSPAPYLISNPKHSYMETKPSNDFVNKGRGQDCGFHDDESNPRCGPAPYLISNPKHSYMETKPSNDFVNKGRGQDCGFHDDEKNPRCGPVVIAGRPVISGSPNPRNAISYGPWGGNGGMMFDDGVYTGVREVHLTRYGGLVSIRVCYDMNGQAIWGNKHGGAGGIRLDKIAFDYPSEILTHITGYYESTIFRGPTVVKSLTFYTNKRKYGPFGDEQGISFSSGSGNGIIVGFHGRKGWFIDSIGVHVSERPVSLPQIYGTLFSSSYDSFNVSTDLSTYQVFPVIVKEPASGGPAPSGTKGMKELGAQWVGAVVREPAPPSWSDADEIVREHAPPPLWSCPNATLKEPAAAAAPWRSSAGPWGGEGGRPWDDGLFSGVKKIFFTKGEAIYCIQAEYDRNGQSVWSARHGGGSEGSSHTIKFEYPDEVLTSVCGYHGSLTGDDRKGVIKSLTFCTNKGRYGPYGEETGTFFTSSKTDGRIVGFHGRSSCYLTALGVHTQPWSNDNRDYLLGLGERGGPFKMIITHPPKR